MNILKFSKGERVDKESLGNCTLKGLVEEVILNRVSMRLSSFSTYFKNTSFDGCKVDGSEFHTCKFDGNIKNPTFNVSSFKKTTFVNCIFNRVSFVTVDFKNCEFRNCEFDDCEFESCGLGSTSFKNCSFEHSNIKNSILNKFTEFYCCHFVMSRLSNNSISDDSKTIEFKTGSMTNCQITWNEVDVVKFSNVILTDCTVGHNKS